MLQNSIYYLVGQVDPGMISWLTQQGPSVVIFGVMVWWLARRLEKVEAERNNLAESLIKLTAMYEAKVDKNDGSDKEIIEKLGEILNILKYGKGD